MNGSKTAGFIEYLDYFSESGEFTVTVSFEQSSAKIATLSSSQKSIEDLKMILAAQETPTMSFDEHLGDVRKIHLDPTKKTIHINVRSLKGSRTMNKPTPQVFTDMATFITVIGSAENTAAVEDFFFSPKHRRNTVEEVVLESVTGSTFRAFRFKSDGIDHLKPSVIYREWVSAWLTASLPELLQVTEHAQLQRLVMSGAKELSVSWLKQTEQRNDIGFGRAIKLLNLTVKHALRLTTIPEKQSRKLREWLDVPLDSYTLQGIATIAPDLRIPANAAMGHVKDEAFYLAVQAKIRSLCAPKYWPIHYEMAAWNMAHN